MNFAGRGRNPFHRDDAGSGRGSNVLFDVKTLGFVSKYYTRGELKQVVHSQNVESLAVGRRARAVNTEYLAKAKKRDLLFLLGQELDESADPPDVDPGLSAAERQRARAEHEANAGRGPYQKALRTFGEVKGLVVGAFGEFSSEWDVLINFLAWERAKTWRRATGTLLEVGQLAAIERNRMVSRLGSLAARGLAQVTLRVATDTVTGADASIKSRSRRQQELELQTLVDRQFQFPRAARGFTGGSRRA